MATKMLLTAENLAAMGTGTGRSVNRWHAIQGRARRSAACACGWGCVGIAEVLNGRVADHLDEGGSGCDHVVDLVDLGLMLTLFLLAVAFVVGAVAGVALADHVWELGHGSDKCGRRMHP